VLLIVAAAPGGTVDHAFAQELADARPRGRPLAGLLRRDPDRASRAAASGAAQAVLHDGVASESLSRHSCASRRESMSDPSPNLRADVAAALPCAGGPLVRRAVLPETARLAARRAAKSCRS
jgi:hypothetical protein